MLRRFTLFVVLGALVACSAGGGAHEATRAPAKVSSTTTTSAPPAPEPQVATIETTTTTAPAPVVAPAATLPKAAGDPLALAFQIAAAEGVVRDPASTSDAKAAAALVQQVAYRQLGAHPEWDQAVLGAVPPHLQAATYRNADARREFRAMHTKLSDNLPTWRIVEPAAPEALLADYKEAEASFGIPWQILAAINLVETGMGRIRGTSTAGAQGPMQFLPATWASFGAGGDINSAHDSILAAGRYLAHNGGASDIAGALWNYNHSYHYVRGVEAYAAIMQQDPQAFYGYYHWAVIYLTTAGDIWLPLGYEALAPIPVAEYLATHPQ